MAKPRTKTTKPLRQSWWTSEKDSKELADRLLKVVDKLEQSLRLDEACAEWLRFVYNRRYTSADYGRMIHPGPLQAAREMVVNSIQNIQQTITAHTTVHRPRPRFLTVDGDWSLRRQAQKLQRFCEGTMQIVDGYEESAKAFDDAIIFGTGFVKVHASGGTVHVERVWPAEILVDEAGCTSAPPRSLFQRKWVAREVLRARYPDHVDAIEMCQSGYKISDSSGDLLTSDLVRVTEAWHLPSSSESGDGRHVVAISDAVLLDEEWVRDHFPFATIRWTRIPVGYYGQGLTEQLKPIQQEKDKLLRRIQRAQHLFATVQLIAEEGSINKDQFSNEVGTIIWKKKGQPDPLVHTPASMNGQVFDHVWALDQKEYEIAGTSQFSATSTKPAGDLSGVALRSLRDVQAQRHSVAAMNWDKLHLDIYRLIVEAAREAYDGEDETSDFVARYTDGPFYLTIKWSEVNLERDAYKLELWPTNILPAEPSGKLATVQELMAAGLIDRDVANRLLDFPDLDSATSLSTAALNVIDWAIEKMMDSGELVEPQPYWNLAAGIRRVGQECMRAKMEGAPQDRIDVLDEWIEQASALLTGAGLESPAYGAVPALPPSPEAAPLPGPGGLPPTGLPPEAAGLIQ